MHIDMSRNALSLAVAAAAAFALTLGHLGTVHSGSDEGKTVASDSSYEVKVKLPGPVAKGAQATAFVTVKAASGWHVNKEFPIKLTIDAPDGVTVEKAKQKQGDAIKFNDHEAKFAVKYTGSSAGSKAFTGKFKFAVCTDDTCNPKRVKLAFNVDIE
jgi:hypothetical protein